MLNIYLKSREKRNKRIKGIYLYSFTDSFQKFEHCRIITFWTPCIYIHYYYYLWPTYQWPYQLRDHITCAHITRDHITCDHFTLSPFYLWPYYPVTILLVTTLPCDQITVDQITYLRVFMHHSRVVSASDCGVRGPRFESCCWQLCLSRQLLRYTVLGTGCAPLL